MTKCLVSRGGLLSKQPLPPGLFIAKAFYGERGFAPAAAPDFELLVIISLGAAAARAGCPDFLGGLFIQLFPVFVMPARSGGHFHSLHVQFDNIAFLKDVVALDHNAIVLA